MSDASKTLAGPGDSQLSVAEAERQLAQLCRAASASGSEAACAVQLLAAAFMTSVGMGLRLFAQPGVAARLVAAICAVVVTVRIGLPLVLARMTVGEADEQPGWVAAAAVHCASLPGRIPAAALAAVDRYLPVLGHRYRSAHLYVGPCAGAGKHTPVCASVGMFAPPSGGGRRLLLIIGEHVAINPTVATASLAHEAGHANGRTCRVFRQLHGMRQAGWGWAAAGAVGASWGWLGVLVGAAAFQAGSLLLVWVVEVLCDRAALRSVDRADYRDALTSLAVMSREYRRQRPRLMRVIRFCLCSLAGPSHPPLALRRALIRPPRAARKS